MKKGLRVAKNLVYPSFDSWAEQQMKNPAFRTAYIEEKRILELALRLGEARRAKNLTQEKLAKKVHMKPEAISRLESGTHNMTVETLVRVAGALGKRVEIR